MQPFSISSAPHETHTTFHIKALGDWTQSLLDLSIKKTNEIKNNENNIDVETGKVIELVPQNNGNSRNHQNYENYHNYENNGKNGGGSELRSFKMFINLEGPYGLPSIDLTGGTYTMFLLIGGGIGKYLSYM